MLNTAVITEPTEPPSSGYETANRSLGLSGVVLVVDDEAMLRRMLRRTLERFGLEVIEAENGVDAIQILERLGDRIDLVLMDWNMPVMSGEETVRGVRDISPDVPVLVTSGFDAQHLELKKMSAEIQGFIQKPFRSSGLKSLLGTYLVN